MISAGRYVVRGHHGRCHDSVWSLRLSGGSVVTSTSLSADADVEDLAVAVHEMVVRALTVAESARVSVRPAVGTEHELCAMTSDDVYGDLPTTQTIHELLVEISASPVAVGADLQISCPVSQGLTTDDDFVALVGLWDVDVPVGTSKHRRGVLDRWPLMRPVAPADAHLFTAEDPRLAELLLNHHDLRTMVKSTTVASWDHVNFVLSEVELLRSELHEATLEKECSSILGAELGKLAYVWLEVMGRRYGLDGQSVWTLQQVADAVGRSRARASQVQVGMRTPTRPLWAPAAEAVIELTAHLLPCSASELGQAMVQAGLSETDEWHAEALEAALALTGRQLPLVEVSGLVARVDQAEMIGRTGPAARALSDLSGFARLADVVERLAEEGIIAERSSVRAVLSRLPQVHWIGTEQFWVDHSPKRNRLVNTCRRILTVIQPQSVDSVLEGVDRNFRWRASTGGAGRLADIRIPTPDELTSFLRSHPDFIVDDSTNVRSAVALEMDDLGPEKLVLVGIFAQRPNGILDRNSVIAASSVAGMSIATATVFLTYGECFQRFAPNVWGLRGLEVTPDMVAKVQREAVDVRQASDRRWIRGTTPSGRPWLATKITQTVLFSGVITTDWVSNPIKDVELELVGLYDGESLGRSRFSGTFNYGYGPALRHSAAAVGQVMRLLADPSDGVCYVEVGGDDLLSEPFDL